MRILLRIKIAVLVTLLAGCSVLGPVKTTPVSSYTLTAGEQTPQPARHGKQVLLIATPTAASGYQSADMIYTLDRYELKSFAKHRWVAPPADMLQPLLLQSLQNSGCFNAVVAPPFSGSADLVLDTKILTLQQEFSGNTSQVTLALQTTLSDSTTRKVVLNQQLQTSVAASANTPYAGVIAANQATQQLLQEITQRVCRR